MFCHLTMFQTNSKLRLILFLCILQSENEAKLNKFIENVNGKEGTSSHLVNVPPGPSLSDALIQSPIVAGEDGQPTVGMGGFGFDFDPNEDPELALVSQLLVNKFKKLLVLKCTYIYHLYS